MSLVTTEPGPLLTDRDSVTKERGATANVVKELAEDTRFAARKNDLMQLSKALRAGSSHEAIWRDTNLFDAFPAQSTITVVHSGRRVLAGALGALAGLTVFLPVMWTWWSLRQATLDYQEMLRAGQGDGLSFLQLWTTGFDNRLDQVFQLPHVAQGSVLLILISVVLIVIERVVSRAAESAEEAEFAACEARLAHALTQAQITVNSHYIQDPLEGIDLLTEAADRLLQAQERTREASETLMEAAKDLEASTNAATAQLGSTVTDVATRLKSSADGVSAALLSSVGDVSASLGTSVAAATSALQTSVTKAVGDMSARVTDISKASAGMAKAATTSAAAKQGLVAAAEDISRRTADLDSSMEKRLREMVTSITGELQEFGDQVGQITQGTTEVEHSLARHTSAMQQQITELTQIRVSLSQLAADRMANPDSRLSDPPSGGR